MSFGAPIILAPLFLEYHDRTSATLIDDLRRDFRALDQRLTHEDTLFAVHQSDIAQFHCAADVARKAFDLDEGSVFDPILLAACFYYCIHEVFASPDRTSLCITVISKVSRKPERARPWGSQAITPLFVGWFLRRGQRTLEVMKMAGKQKTQPRKFVLRPYRRIPTWYSAYYLSGSVIGKGVVMNLSRTGLRLLGEHSLKPGTDVSIRVTVEEGGPSLEISRASIRWINQYEFGLKIDHLPPGAAHRIVGLINDHIGVRPSQPR
jgi:hypothetical protein